MQELSRESAAPLIPLASAEDQTRRIELMARLESLPNAAELKRSVRSWVENKKPEDITDDPTITFERLVPRLIERARQKSPALFLRKSGPVPTGGRQEMDLAFLHWHSTMLTQAAFWRTPTNVDALYKAYEQAAAAPER